MRSNLWLHFKIGQKPSASDKFTDEAKILSNTSEPVTEDKSGIEKSESNKDTNEEAATIFNPEVAEELSEIPAETSAESNEDIENVLGKLAEVKNEDHIL